MIKNKLDQFVNRDIVISEQERGHSVSRIQNTAALRTVGFIAINLHSLKSTNTTILGLAAKACDVHVSYRRSSHSITSYKNLILREGSNSEMQRNSLRLFIICTNETELDRVIGFYTILGIKTQMVRFSQEGEFLYIFY